MTKLSQNLTILQQINRGEEMRQMTSKQIQKWMKAHPIGTAYRNNAALWAAYVAGVRRDLDEISKALNEIDPIGSFLD